MKGKIRVYRGFKSDPRWFVSCDICAGVTIFGLAFQPMRHATSHALAMAWALQHARRHAAAMCPVCEHKEPINDDSTTVEARQ